MSLIQDFEDIVLGSLDYFIKLSHKIDQDLGQIGELVREVFNAQLQHLKNMQSHQLDQMIKEIEKNVAAVQNFKKCDRSNPYFLHLIAVSEGISAMFWISIKLDPVKYIADIIECVKYNTNRILKERKDDLVHVDWVKSWLGVLNDVEEFARKCNANSFSNYNLNKAAAVGDFNETLVFAQINLGKITSLNPASTNLTTINNPQKVYSQVGIRLEGKQWIVENQRRKHDLLLDNIEMNKVIYMYNCFETTLTVKGKINSITMDTCKKTNIVFDSLISTMEFINCDSAQMQVNGKVPTILIHKTDNCLIYLSPESLDVEIITSKSSEVNILVPSSDGEYIEYPVPHQFKTKVVPGKGLKTTVVENI